MLNPESETSGFGKRTPHLEKRRERKLAAELQKVWSREVGKFLLGLLELWNQDIRPGLLSRYLPGIKIENFVQSSSIVGWISKCLRSQPWIVRLAFGCSAGSALRPRSAIACSSSLRVIRLFVTARLDPFPDDADRQILRPLAKAQAVEFHAFIDPLRQFLEPGKAEA